MIHFPQHNLFQRHEIRYNFDKNYKSEGLLIYIHEHTP